MSAPPAVECVQLKKTYRLGFAFAKKVEALKGIDLRVEPGEIFGIIGPNGAGKSTAIKILLNLVYPTAGEARLFGRPVVDRRAREGVGYVPESPVPYEHLTGKEYVQLQARLAGLRGAEVTSEVSRVIEAVDMGRAEALPIRRYSKGMTQRIMLAGALLARPRLVILDEPTSGLDPLGRRLVRDLILEQRRAGGTVLFCTHIISDVESLCDRVALVVGGTIHKTGRIQDLVSATATHEVTVEGVAAEPIRALLGPAVLRVEATGSRTLVHVPDPSLQTALGKLVAAGYPVTRVQPERITLEETFMAAVRASSGVHGGIE